MSDVDSDSSSDSGNNNDSPFFNHYLGIPRVEGYEMPDSPDLEIESSSDSDDDSLFNQSSDSSSSNTDIILHNASEDPDYPSDGTSSSSESSSFFAPNIDGRNCNTLARGTASTSNTWCITKELYNREIGLYNRSSFWGTKFYQSAVGVQKLKLSRQLKEHDGCVNTLDFNETGDVIASGSDDCRICLWDWAKGKCLLKHNSIHNRNIFQVKFLPNHGNTHIVSSARDGLILLSTVSNSEVICSKIVARHDRSCNKLGVHRDQPFVVLSCGDDGVVKNIDIRESPIIENQSSTNLLEIRSSNGFIMHLYGIDVNPFNMHEFIVNGDDEYVRMYDKRKIGSEQVKKFRRTPQTVTGDDDEIYEDGSIINRSRSSIYRDSHITSAVYNYCGTEILASYSEEDIYLFDVNGSIDSHIHSYSGHLNRTTVKGVNFYGPKSDYVVSGSDCGSIFIWDKKSEAIVQKKHGDVKGAVNVLLPHPHVPTLATSGLDKTIKIWEPSNTWRQPNRKKLRMCVVKNRGERARRERLLARRDHNMMMDGSNIFIRHNLFNIVSGIWR